MTGEPDLPPRWPRALAAIALVLALGGALLGHRSTAEEYRCFLHCDGEPPETITQRGWPLPYSSSAVVPGDPPMRVRSSFAPLALVIDLLALCGLLTLVAFVADVVHGRRHRGRARLLRGRTDPDGRPTTPRQTIAD